MKKIKIILFVLTSLIFNYLLCTKFYYDNSNAYSLIVTFLSITTGFSITALSIIATSEFSKELYSKESEKNNSLTLLHELVYGIKNATLMFIITIALILFDNFANKIEKSFYINKYEISLTAFISALIWYFTILSFFEFIKIFCTFSKFVIRNAARK